MHPVHRAGVIRAQVVALSYPAIFIQRPCISLSRRVTAFTFKARFTDFPCSRAPKMEPFVFSAYVAQVSPVPRAALHRKLEIGCGGIIRGQIWENGSPMSRKGNARLPCERAFLHSCFPSLSLPRYPARNYFRRHVSRFSLSLSCGVALIDR